MFRTAPVPAALIEPVNVLGSHTDTIATMTGTIMGAVSNAAPEGDLLDRQYIKDGAIRLFEIANGDRRQKSFKYPDLMNWRPPRTMMDAVGYCHETVAVLGTAEKPAAAFRR
jgi:hypothetical protein